MLCSYADTHYGVAYGFFEIPYECLLHSYALLCGYLSIGGHSHIEANIVVMLLHRDVHFGMTYENMEILSICLLAFLCTST